VYIRNAYADEAKQVRINKGVSMSKSFSLKVFLVDEVIEEWGREEEETLIASFELSNFKAYAAMISGADPSLPGYCPVNVHAVLDYIESLESSCRDEESIMFSRTYAHHWSRLHDSIYSLVHKNEDNYVFYLSWS
jgi:hypothetical protein